jgi:hypothetical protein
VTGAPLAAGLQSIGGPYRRAGPFVVSHGGAIRSFRMSSALTRVPLVPLVIATGGRNAKVLLAVAMAKSLSVSLNPLARMASPAHLNGVSPEKSFRYATHRWTSRSV